MRFISFVGGMMLIGYALMLNPFTRHTEAPNQNKKDEVVMQLFRRDYATTNYASYLLEIRSSSEAEVRAYIDLRHKSKKLASIPLLPTNQKNSKGGQSIFLRVNCVAMDEISDASYFYVFVTEPHTGKMIKETRVLLSSANLVPQLPDEGADKAVKPSGGSDGF